MYNRSSAKNRHKYRTGTSNATTIDYKPKTGLLASIKGNEYKIPDINKIRI